MKNMIWNKNDKFTLKSGKFIVKNEKYTFWDEIITSWFEQNEDLGFERKWLNYALKQNKTYVYSHYSVGLRKQKNKVWM